MHTYPLAPAESRYLWLIIPLVLLLLGVVAVLMITIWGSRAASFTVSPAGLQLNGDLYGRLIPAADLQIDGARRVDLATETALAPKWRRMGTGLPGYQAGWFSLMNGDKALLYLTDRGRAVYIPTTAGYCLLLSPQDPDGFLQSLRALRPAGPAHPGESPLRP